MVLEETLKGTRVRIVEGDDVQRKLFADNLLTLGATVLESLGEEADVVIASTAVGKEFLAAIEGSTTPEVVTSAWISECQRCACKAKPERFRLAPLAGLQICVTGLTEVDERDSLPAHISALGAEYFRDMRRGMCTHLVAKAAAGEKYKHALMWGGVHVVSAAWLVDSMVYGVRQDESLYSLTEPKRTGSMPPGTSISEALAAAAAKRRLELAAGLRSQRSSHAGNLSAGPAAGPGLSGVVASGNRECVISTAISLDNAASKKEALSTEPPPGPDDCFFLGWVRLHLVGCSPAEASQVVGLSCESGATREPELHRDITHVVVGADITAAQLAAVRDHVSAYSHCKVVRPAWLQHCVIRRCHVEAEGSWLVKAAEQPLAQAAMPAALARASTLGRVASTLMHQTDEASRPGEVAIGSGVEEQPPGQGLPQLAEGGSTCPGLLFQGLLFTLVAVQGSEVEATAKRLIWANGGKVFTASNAKQVADPSKTFAICPHSLLDERKMQLEKTCEDFRLVPPLQRVTLYWLQTSVDTTTLCPFAARQAPAFRPLPFNLPIRAFEGIRLHAAVYEASSKAAASMLITLLGGTYTDSLSRSNTHLLIPEASGQKAAFARKYNLVTVTALWLTESAYRGLPLDPHGFEPRGVEEGAQQQLTSQSSGSIMPSQLPSTQAAAKPPRMPAAGDPMDKSCTGAGSRGQQQQQPQQAMAAPSQGLLPRPMASSQQQRPPPAPPKGMSKLQAALATIAAGVSRDPAAHMTAAAAAAPATAPSFPAASTSQPWISSSRQDDSSLTVHPGPPAAAAPAQTSNGPSVPGHNASSASWCMPPPNPRPPAIVPAGVPAADGSTVRPVLPSGATAVVPGPDGPHSLDAPSPLRAGATGDDAAPSPAAAAAAGVMSAAFGSADDNLQVIASIHSLIARGAAGAGGPLATAGLPACSQLEDLQPHSPALASGKDTASDPSAQHRGGSAAGGKRHTQDGDKRGGTKRTASEGPDGRRPGRGGRGRGVAHGLEDEASGHGEMSQQVGYDLGPQAAERLTRQRSRSTSAEHLRSSGGGSGVDAGTKQHIISRVQSHGQGRPRRTASGQLDALI